MSFDKKISFDWLDDYTVEKRIGIGKVIPLQALDVIGNISATGDISADTNLDVKKNIQLGGNLEFTTGLAISKFSDDGNLTDSSSSALPTEQAVKTYVDNQINTRAALNGAANQDFAANNLAVSGVVSSGHSSGALQVNNDLTVNGEIATRQLRVSGSVTGSLTIENDLTVNNAIATRQLSVSDAVTGSLTIENDLTVGNAIANNLTVNGNINTTGIISGSSLPPNLIINSYMNILDGNKPAGYAVLGNVTLEAEHPYAKGFEGPYVPEKPSNAATSVDTATQANPYWFGRYNKGSRASRGGLAGGWHSIPDGRILKITGDNSGEHTCVFFPFESNVLTNKVHFKAWLKITSGSRVGLGGDSGYKNRLRGLVITKGQTDEAQDGWYQIDAVIGISEVTSLDSLAFSIGIEASSSFEVYLALPYLSNLDNDTWLPSVSDMLSRDGLTVHPSSRQVGIGTNNPRNPLGIRATRQSEELISFEDPSGRTKWHINQNLGGTNPGLNFVETGVADGRLFIKAGGNVGIGTSSPKAKLDVTGGALNISNPGNGKVLAFLNTDRHWQLRQFGTGAPTALELASVGGGGNKNLLISTTGRVGIGTTSPGQTLDVRGTIGNNSTRYHSDVRWKKNVETIPNALKKILQLRGVNFEWKQEEYAEMNFNSGKQLGVIAQEVEQVVPEIVAQNEEGYKTVDYSRLTALLIEAIKEIKTENNSLKKILNTHTLQPTPDF